MAFAQSSELPPPIAITESGFHGSATSRPAATMRVSGFVAERVEGQHFDPRRLQQPVALAALARLHDPLVRDEKRALEAEPARELTEAVECTPWPKTIRVRGWKSKGTMCSQLYHRQNRTPEGHQEPRSARVPGPPSGARCQGQGARSARSASNVPL